jgi:hypothetical protein
VDFRDQFVVCHRLDQVFDSALAHAPDFVSLLVLGGDHDDGNGLCGRILCQLARRLKAIHARHDDIHEYAIRARRYRLPDSFFTAVGHERVKAGLLEHILKQMQLGGRIVDD